MKIDREVGALVANTESLGTKRDSQGKDSANLRTLLIQEHNVQVEIGKRLVNNGFSMSKANINKTQESSQRDGRHSSSFTTGGERSPYQQTIHQPQNSSAADHPLMKF